jgi:hypothetical protein
MHEIAVQRAAGSAYLPSDQGMNFATPWHPDGLEADRHFNSDPSLPPPDFHHDANAHGFLPDGVRALAIRLDVRPSGHASTIRPRNATRGFVLQDSSSGKTIVRRNATWTDHAREI